MPIVLQISMKLSAVNGYGKYKPKQTLQQTRHDVQSDQYPSTREKQKADYSH